MYTPPAFAGVGGSTAIVLPKKSPATPGLLMVWSYVPDLKKRTSPPFAVFGSPTRNSVSSTATLVPYSSPPAGGDGRMSSWTNNPSRRYTYAAPVLVRAGVGDRCGAPTTTNPFVGAASVG